MEKLLKKGHRGLVSQLFSLDVQKSMSSSPLDFKMVINNHSTVFGDISKGLPLNRDHDHAIHFQLENVAPNTRPYGYPCAQKSEIENIIQETLEVSIIKPSQSYFSSPLVMVMKKGGSWCLCPNYRQVNKMTIKYNFPIPVIDELHKVMLFTKLYPCFKYHEIIMRQECIPKTNFRTHEGHYEIWVIPFRLINAP
jgi:hypothetical protein